MLVVVVINGPDDSLRAPTQLLDVGPREDVVEQISLAAILFLIRKVKLKNTEINN